MAASRFATFLKTFDPDRKKRGTQWEHVCKWFLETDPVYRAQLKKVWLWDKWPGRWGPDAGIDLVAQAKDGTLWAIQAKAYDLDNSVTKKDMDTFLSESARAEFAHRLLIATTGHVSAAAIRASKSAEKPVSTVLRHDLDHREGFVWPVSFSAWAKGRIPKPKPKRPYPHVTRAIRATLQKLHDHDRGQVIMACGTGKTLTALWVHERLPSSRTLVLVPSLSLLGQTLQEWVGNAKVPFETLPVCSDDTVRRGDALVSSTLDLGYPATTDPAAVRTFLKRRGGRVVFSTYQSSPVIASALAGTRQRFDLVIADEAHRCAGAVSDDFATVLDQKKIPARKRVFMTATPRVFTGRVVKEAAEDDLEIASMDDEATFGPVLHRLTFGTAIERDLLSDYRVVVVGIDQARYRRYAEQGRLLELEGVGRTDARALASHIGLAKAMRTYDMQRVISFHSRIAGATRFAGTLPEVIAWMPARERPSGRVWAKPVSGEMSSGVRATRLDELRAVDDGERGVLSNARCLGEGIDVPSLDGVAFVDPRRSQVDIVQAVGRAIRKGNVTGTATIVIPVFVDTTADAEDALDVSAFRAITGVLRALRDHDETLADELDGIRRSLGVRPTSRLRLPKKIFLDLPRGIATTFSTAIRTRVVQLTTSSWEEGYAHLEAYVKAEGTAEVPTAYRTAEGFKLGHWVDRQRSRKDTLSADRRRRVERLKGWAWEVRRAREDAAWEEGYAQLKAYVKAEGDTRVPQSYRCRDSYLLGAWARNQRSRKDTLSADRRRRLQQLKGWVWDVLEANWEAGYAHLTAYVKAKGNARVPQGYRTRDGYRLGQWVGVQRSTHEILSADRRRRLERLKGWAWVATDFWEVGYGHLEAYVKAKGDARVPSGYRTRDGHRLGDWITTQRVARKTLSADRRRRLQQLKGWVWDVLEANWEEGYAHLKAYVKAKGNARVPQRYTTRDGYRLGQWANVLRAKQKTLSPVRRQRLERAKGWAWDLNVAVWEDGYAQLKAYVKTEGTAEVPTAYRTAEGFKLGHWVSKQRSNRKTLSADRRRRLERVKGWAWEVKRVRDDAAWKEGYAQLKAYVKAEGDAQVPFSHTTRDGHRLGMWVRQKRGQRKTLSSDRRRRLERMKGWVWNLNVAVWEDGYAQLTAYVKAEGDARVPQSYTTRDGYRLGQWVSVQRLDKAKMSGDRRRRLEQLTGWVWNASPSRKASKKK